MSQKNQKKQSHEKLSMDEVTELEALSELELLLLVAGFESEIIDDLKPVLPHQSEVLPIPTMSVNHLH